MSASTVLPSAESVVGTGAPQVVPAQQAVVTAGRATELPRTVVEMAREQSWGQHQSIDVDMPSCVQSGEQ